MSPEGFPRRRPRGVTLSATIATTLGIVVFVVACGGSEIPARSAGDTTAATDAPSQDVSGVSPPPVDSTLPLEEGAVRFAADIPVVLLDSLLAADQGLEQWLRDSLGVVAVSYELNDCGEQTGDPAIDAGRDFPACVDASGVRADHWAVGVSIAVGTFGRGIQGDPVVRDAYLRCGEQLVFLRRLSELAEPPTVCSGYEGLRYPPLLEGLADRGGAVFTDRGTEDHAIALVDSVSGRGSMLWFVRFTHREGREAHWQVRAVVPVVLAPDEMLVFAPGSCTVGAEPDAEVLAVAVRADAERLTEIRRAWRANRSAGRLDVIPVAGITCFNIDWA